MRAAYGADRSLDTFLVNDQSINYGRGYSDMNDSGGNLTWGESYLLDGYMNMYEATEDKRWLDKVVDHGDRVLATAEDGDGDGYSGWGSETYSHNQIKNDNFTVVGAPLHAGTLLTNPGFEDAEGTSNVPARWQQQGNPSKTYRSTTSTDVFSGIAGAVVENDGINENRLVQSLTYTPGETYEIELFGGLYSSQTQGVTDVYNATTGQVLATLKINHVGFEQYVFQFNAPSEGELQLRLGLVSYSESNGRASFDQISIKPTGDRAHLVINGGLEKVDSSDVTKPEGWNRWLSNETDIYLVSDSDEVHSGSNSLAITTHATNTTWKGLKQSIPYEASQQYTVSFWGKVSRTNSYGRIRVYNATDNVVVQQLIFNNTSWQKHTFSFTAPASVGNNLEIMFYETDYKADHFTIMFDDLTIDKVLPNLVQNGGS